MIQQTYKYVTSSLWSLPMFFELKITNVLKSSEWGLEKIELPWEHIFVGVDVFPVELLAYQVSMVCDAKWPR